MPYFHNYSDTREFGKITVTPKQWWRRIMIKGYNVFPYVTTGKIEFTLWVERVPEYARNVYIRQGDGSHRTLTTIINNSTTIEANAEYSGDTKLLLASAGYSFKNNEYAIDKEGLVLFDDYILSLNRYIFGIGGIVLTAFFSCLCVLLSWSLGFIKIVPFWEAWINP